MEESQRNEHREIYRAVGVGPDWADAIFDLRLAGWTAEQVAGLLRGLSDCLAAGMTNDEIGALLGGAAAKTG